MGSKDSLSSAGAVLGKAGGEKKTAKQAKARRENGKKGGRPKDLLTSENQGALHLWVET